MPRNICISCRPVAKWRNTSDKRGHAAVPCLRVRCCPVPGGTLAVTLRAWLVQIDTIETELSTALKKMKENEACMQRECTYFLFEGLFLFEALLDTPTTFYCCGWAVVEIWRQRLWSGDAYKLTICIAGELERCRKEAEKGEDYARECENILPAVHCLPRASFVHDICIFA